MLVMPGFLKAACILVIGASMLAAASVYFGQVENAVNIVIACVIFLAGMIALSLS